MASTISPLSALAAASGGTVIGDDSVRVSDVTHDSRQVGPSTLFVAIAGSSHDGHDFVPAVVDAGAPAVMVSHRVDTGVAQLLVENTRISMAAVAAEVHGHPSRRLRLVGVTGTNGKTTVTHMLESIVMATGQVAGLIGTVHTRVGGENIPNTRTTPESSDFQRLLARMVDRGAAVVAAEVSSHAVALHRVDATRFAVAAFTNLSQDHLDFHGDMDAYMAAKASLFEPDRCERAVVFVDDPAGAELAAGLSVPCLTVGAGADLEARDRRVSVDGSTFRLVAGPDEAEVSLAIGGNFNIDNALVAAGCALSLGIPLADVAAGLSRFAGVPGRFEVVSGSDPVRVVVDYAHTPAGIESAVAAVRAAGLGAGLGAGNRVIAVFGAGGDRDREKRPQMGLAALAADVVVVTSDNPRSEDPEAIIDAVMAAVPADRGVHREVDRRRAIAWAIAEAAPGDIVLILGRGHERGQEVAGRSIPFDDRLVAREALSELRAGQP